MNQLSTIAAGLVLAENLRPRYIFFLSTFYPVMRGGCGGVTADRFLRLYYDDDEIGLWEPEWVATRIIAQVEKYVGRYIERQNGRNQICWDMAVEISVNCRLAGERLRHPPGTLFPEDFKLPDDLSAEEYYRLLYERCMARRAQLEAEEEQALDADDFSEELAEIAGEELPTVGSAGSEELKEWELPEDESVPTIDALLAMMQARDRQIPESPPGVVPGTEERTVGETRESAVDWRVRLRSLHGRTISLASAGMDDYSFLAPDPDIGLHPGVICPGMVGSIRKTVVVLDTSGSMGETRVAQSIAETGEILFQSEGGVWVVVCDAAVHSVRQVTHPQQLTLVGGGGTEMSLGIQAAAAVDPDVIVVITDGETSWPSEPPAAPVIIVLVGTGKPPHWAEVIRVKM